MNDMCCRGPETAPVDLTQRAFFGDIVGALAGTLEDVIGLEDASAFVGVVGDTVGLRLRALYEAEMGDIPNQAEMIARILVDLKRRIGGKFSIEAVDETGFVLVNRRCPFGARVEGRPSLCMMTTNVFGRIAAETNGYARVKVTESIAAGDPGCRVFVSLERGADEDWYEFYT